MNSVSSVDTLQDKFSEVKLYSVTPPQKMNCGTDLTDSYSSPPESDNVYYPIFGSTHDSHVVSLISENQETNWNEAIKRIRPGSRQSIESSSFSKQNITLGWEHSTDFDFVPSMDVFRAIVKTLHSDLTHGFSTPSLKWFALLKVQQSPDEIFLREASLEHFAILSGILTPSSFSMSGMYEDLYGGKVIDYLKGDERVSCIVSMNHVQILSFLGDVFKEKIFQHSGEVKLEVAEYMEFLLTGRQNDSLESTKES